MWTCPCIAEKPLNHQDFLVEHLELLEEVCAAPFLAEGLAFRHLGLCFKQEKRVGLRVAGGGDLAGKDGRRLPLRVDASKLRELLFNLSKTEFI